jgi:anti-anti-sigma regulatory factor
MQGICEAKIEVDVSTAPAFAAALRAEIDTADSRDVFIDCSAITSVDRSAFHALVYAHRYAIGHDHALIIRNLYPNCAQVLRLCDRHHELTIEA